MAKTKPFDVAAYLNSPEAIAAYLSEAFETNDAAFIKEALGTAARAQRRGPRRKRGSVGRSIGSARSRRVFLTLPTVLSTGQILSHSAGRGRSRCGRRASHNGAVRGRSC
jgi:hypothetical protein